MENKIIRRIVQETGIPNLVELLSSKLAATDLQSLLMAVYQKKAENVSLSKLRDQYLNNRFLKPSLFSPVTQLKLDQLCFDLAGDDFEPINLSPLAPLGACSVLAPVDQNKVVSTSRNTEIMSDPTNVMAIESAKRRKQLLIKSPKNTETIALCCSHRVTRAQFFDFPNAFAHFQLFALCSAGRDTGSFEFEIEALEKHLVFYLNLLTSAKDFHAENIQVLVTPVEKRLQPLVESKVFKNLSMQFPQASFQFDFERKNGVGYYQNLCFTINAANISGEIFHLVDGGLTDWTQQLLGSKKERCMISAIGSERFGLLFYVHY